MQALSSSAQSIETTKQTFAMISNSVRPLFDILQSNYGPCGTYKMLVSGGGDIKITKDGGTLLGEMQIRNPITSLIAKTVSMQEKMAGDGTIALVLLISSLIMESEKFVMDGVHVSHIIEGITMGIEYCQKIIQEMAIPVTLDRPLLIDIARCSVATKIPGELANLIAEQCVDAVHHIFDRETMQLNLHMVEVMHMTHKTARDTQLVRGIVMDHGGRHPNMPRELKDCFILISNVSFEYEKTEVNADVGYSSAQAREAMFRGEREFIDKRCQQVVDLKNQVCKGNQGFVLLTMGGIDTHSLDIFAKHNILGLRRVKRRNLERLTLCCGGLVVNSTENLRPSNLGHAGHVKHISVGEENYTIVDECKNPKSVTILIKGPNQYTINQLRDAIQDGLMSTANALVEQSALPGACAFELTASRRLMDYAKKVSATNMKARIGVEILSRALESLPKSLAQNAGFDANSLILENQAISSDEDARKTYYGVNVATGKDSNTFMGALVSKEHLAKVKSYVAIAREEGATIRCGDEDLNLPEELKNGYFMRPTIVTDVADNSRLMTEEIFGPVVCVVPFESVDEVIERANSVNYGLAASVWSSDVTTLHRVSQKLHAGTVWANCWMVRDLNMPFGGMKESGTGRESAKDSLEFFSEEKTICVKL